MYSGYQLCDQLKPKQRCFRLREFKQGEYHDLIMNTFPRIESAEITQFR